MAFQRPPAVRREAQTATPQPRQRRFLRAPVNLAATFLLAGAGDPQNGDVTDLGGGGLRLSTGDDLPPGSTVQIRFRLPLDDEEVAVTGRTVMSFFNGSKKRYEHGVAFAQIDAARRDAIVRYITELSPGVEPD
jgi:c-di-GMP-binding flagellar brake protein YcgR